MFGVYVWYRKASGQLLITIFTRILPPRLFLGMYNLLQHWRHEMKWCHELTILSSRIFSTASRWDHPRDLTFFFFFSFRCFSFADVPRILLTVASPIRFYDTRHRVTTPSNEYFSRWQIARNFRKSLMLIYYARTMILSLSSHRTTLNDLYFFVNTSCKIFVNENVNHFDVCTSCSTLTRRVVPPLSVDNLSR